MTNSDREFKRGDLIRTRGYIARSDPGAALSPGELALILEEPHWDPPGDNSLREVYQKFTKWKVVKLLLADGRVVEYVFYRDDWEFVDYE